MKFLTFDRRLLDSVRDIVEISSGNLETCARCSHLIAVYEKQLVLICASGLFGTFKLRNEPQIAKQFMSLFEDVSSVSVFYKDTAKYVQNATDKWPHTDMKHTYHSHQHEKYFQLVSAFIETQIVRMTVNFSCFTALDIFAGRICIICNDLLQLPK